MENATGGFVHLADVGDMVAARVCAALLESAGIEVRLHGEALGPYPMTVGRMAVTQLWVPETDLEEARDVMLTAEIDYVLGTEDRRGAVADPGSLPMRAIALLAAVILAAAVIRALMRVF